MSFPTRVTRPLLDVLELFVQASGEGTELHGWTIKKAAGLSGATTYKMFDRLEDAGWITGRWEAHNPDPTRPPRRLYRLTPTGETGARALLAERRPGWARAAPRPAGADQGAGPRPPPHPLHAAVAGHIRRPVPTPPPAR
ncbi:PadR family transcriptional regulator [Spirillospora sp. NBC_01491]|uniref:PadR family transcriptional regulator n=1 Tax=Spirillospora sp. NBC_01491 TaxID=2976007 RepID=UPI002E3330BF|nr:PadR family transcriptional regulator [Spirillospora sp. NBC_01491]